MITALKGKDMAKEKINKVTLYTLAEASRETGVNLTTLKGRVRTGSLRAYKRGNGIFLDLQDIAEWQPLWSRDYNYIIQTAHASGEPDSAIAAIIGVSRERVRQIRKSLGLKANPMRGRLPKAIQVHQPRTLMEIFAHPACDDDASWDDIQRRA